MSTGQDQKNRADDLPLAVRVKRDRARTAIKSLFKDEKAASVALGLSYTSVRRALRPEQFPSRKSRTAETRLDEIGDALVAKASLAPSWWETGEGEMLATEALALPAQEFRGAPGTRTGPPAGYRLIPFITIEPMASATLDGTIVDVEIEEVSGDTYLPDWYIQQEYGVSPERIRHMQARGDSMVDTIMPGQRLTVALLPYAHALRDGMIYVISTATGVLLKRLLLEPDHVWIWSDNKKRPRVKVAKEAFSRDYRVVAAVLEAAVRF